MSWEQSKAARRRYLDGAFHSRFFVGEGIDIGGGPDPLSQYAGLFPRMSAVRNWDLADGDAQLMAGVANDSIDFVHSSHCLEHMVDPREALSNWLRIVKPGGYLVITIPDEDMYEQGYWPSQYNWDHKWTFTTYKSASWSPRSINLVEFLAEFSPFAFIERIVQLRDFYRTDPESIGIDQTGGVMAECAIECVLRKLPEQLVDCDLTQLTQQVSQLIDQGDLENALVGARQLCRIAPARSENWWMLAQVHFAGDDRAAALRSAQNVVKLESGHLRAREMVEAISGVVDR